MHVIKNSELAQATLPGIEHVTLAGSGQGLQGLSVWKQRIAPGGATPPHRHDCEEVVLIESGDGVLHIEDRSIRFGANTTLVVPRDVVHRIVNTGDAPLDLIGIFGMAPVEVRAPDGQRIELPWSS